MLVMNFKHKESNEEISILFSKDELLDMLSNEIEDKISEQVCNCESVGETNVIDCNCYEYEQGFEFSEISDLEEEYDHWKDAPDWALYKVKLSEGNWFWVDSKPVWQDSICNWGHREGIYYPKSRYDFKAPKCNTKPEDSLIIRGE